MKFYYTGANSFLEDQKRAELSLGKFVSKTPIPNGVDGNLFSMISLTAIDNNDMQIIGIMLKNELGVDVEDVILYFAYPTDTIVKYSVAIVDPNGDPSSGYYMEEIPNNKSLPYYYSQFYEANGLPNAINIGNLASGNYLGLWVKREFLPNIKAPWSDDNLCLNGNPDLPVKDTTILNLDWTEVP